MKRTITGLLAVATLAATPALAACNDKKDAASSSSSSSSSASSSSESSSASESSTAMESASATSASEASSASAAGAAGLDTTCADYLKLDPAQKKAAGKAVLESDPAKKAGASDPAVLDLAVTGLDAGCARPGMENKTVKDAYTELEKLASGVGTPTSIPTDASASVSVAVPTKS